MSRATDIAWCAGLYEGEGTVIYGATHRGPLRIKISSTDRDVLELMVQRSGHGAVYGPRPPNGFGVKPYYEWIANGQAAATLLTAMRPHLGVRRSAALDAKIALWRERPQRFATPAIKAAMRKDRAKGMTYPDIGTKYGVSMAYAYQICRDGKRAARRYAVAPR